jgi:hypothetical protein
MSADDRAGAGVLLRAAADLFALRQADALEEAQAASEQLRPWLEGLGRRAGRTPDVVLEAAAELRHRRDLLRAAHWWADNGTPVFPLKRRDKVPLTKHGCLDASTDGDVIERWWGRWPDANVGLRCGDGLLVVDVDPRRGGEEALAELERQHGPLPRTMTVRTGGGGQHIYLVSIVDLGNSAGKLGPGLDTRGKGGYVVGPPSMHSSGRRYELVVRAAIAPAPAWLLELLAPPRPALAPRLPSVVRASRYGAAALAGLVEEVATAAQGSRNHALNKAAFRVGQLAGGGLVEVDALDALIAAAVGAGLSELEATKTAHSGYRAGRKQPRQVSLGALAGATGGAG